MGLPRNNLMCPGLKVRWTAGEHEWKYGRRPSENPPLTGVCSWKFAARRWLQYCVSEVALIRLSERSAERESGRGGAITLPYGRGSGRWPIIIVSYATIR